MADTMSNNSADTSQLRLETGFVHSKSNESQQSLGEENTASSNSSPDGDGRSAISIAEKKSFGDQSQIEEENRNYTTLPTTRGDFTFSGELRVGIPLHGNLTLTGRTLPSSWKCCVCAHEESNNKDTCGQCKSMRILQWMFNPDGELIQPGMLVEVSCSWNPIRWKSGHFQIGIKEKSVVAMVTDIFRMKKQAELCVLWNDQSDVPFHHGVQYEPVIATVAALMSEPSKSLRLPLTVWCENPDQGASAISPKPYFAKIGYCGNAICGGLYDIIDGDLVGYDDDTLGDEIAQDSNEVARLKVLKTQCIQVRDFRKASQVNDDIKQIEARIKAAHWRAAPKQTWCPYCMWEPSY